MKYIDAEKLRAEIERLKSILTDPLCSQGNILGPDWVAGGNKMLNEISSFITTLQQEQPEADFETEYAKFSNDPDALDYAFPIDLADYKDFARHFYELGLNAGKEEGVSIAESPSKTFPKVNEFDCGSSYRH